MGAASGAKPRLTKNQQVVLDVLESAQTPLSAYQILDVEQVRAEGLKAPLTIYRALDKLIAHGLVHRIESLNAFIACERGPHLHPSAFAICERCRRTVEIRLDDCEAHLVEAAHKHGFSVSSMHVEMAGICPDCASAGGAG